MTEFDEQLPRSNNSFELLPFFHTCDLYNARKNIKKGYIPNPTCDVFAEDIAYLFYGRPAFKYKTSDEADRKMSIYPVAFVIGGKELINVKRIFPFDTGAMNSGMYKRHFHEEMTYLDFELSGDLARVNDIVARFFKTNERYIRFKNVDVKVDPIDMESVELAELYRALSREPADERRATIEVQVGSAIALNSKSLIGLVIPEELAGSEKIRNFVEAAEAQIETYSCVSWNPSGAFALVADAAKRFVERTFDLERDDL